MDCNATCCRQKRPQKIKSPAGGNSKIQPLHASSGMIKLSMAPDPLQSEIDSLVLVCLWGRSEELLFGGLLLLHLRRPAVAFRTYFFRAARDVAVTGLHGTSSICSSQGLRCCNRQHLDYLFPQRNTLPCFGQRHGLLDDWFCHALMYPYLPPVSGTVIKSHNSNTSLLMMMLHPYSIGVCVSSRLGGSGYRGLSAQCVDRSPMVCGD